MYPGAEERMAVWLTAAEWNKVLVSLCTERSEYGDDDGLVSSITYKITEQIGES